MSCRKPSKSSPSSIHSSAYKRVSRNVRQSQHCRAHAAIAPPAYLDQGPRVRRIAGFLLVRRACCRQHRRQAKQAAAQHLGRRVLWPH